MVPSLLLEQWRLGRTWVLNKGLRPDTCGLCTDSSFVRLQGVWEFGGQGPGTLREERQAEGAPWETAWANNHNNTSTRAPVIQRSRAGREGRNGTAARCQQESRRPTQEEGRGKPKRGTGQMMDRGRKKVRGEWKETNYTGGLAAPKKTPFLFVTERKLEKVLRKIIWVKAEQKGCCEEIGTDRWEGRREQLESALCVTTHCHMYRGVCEMASGEINNNERKKARSTSMWRGGDNKDKHKFERKLHKKSCMFAS